MLVEDHQNWVRRALEITRAKGIDPGSSPLGSVIVLDGQMIGGERNQTMELPDATAHAEMMAICRACQDTGQMELRSATLSSALQPCGIGQKSGTWFMAAREDMHAMNFEAKHIDMLDFVPDVYHADIEIVGECLPACAPP